MDGDVVDIRDIGSCGFVHGSIGPLPSGAPACFVIFAGAECLRDGSWPGMLEMVLRLYAI